jgi:Na+-translocating ferredoxin:NAD+ oxidoreductase RnfC subunit
MRRKLTPPRAQAVIGKSACDQCRYCTEFCPRDLLGYAVEPHQVMRSLAFTATGETAWNQWAALCCSCGLCTLYACPEELFPKEACDDAKAALRREGLKWTGPTEVQVHPLHEGRRVPIKSLVRKLDLSSYDLPAPWIESDLRPPRLVIRLKQNAGAANLPLVRPGDQVRAGQPLGEVPPNALGAPIHAPLEGRVAEVNETAIVLETKS